MTGSIAFGALARVVLVAAKGEDHSRMLARAKPTIGADDGGFQYTLELAMSEEIEASVVRWGAPLEGSARVAGELRADCRFSDQRCSRVASLDARRGGSAR